MSEIHPTNSDDNILAAIGHFFGTIVAIIIWAIQKDKSAYVRFQTIQAAGVENIPCLSHTIPQISHIFRQVIPDFYRCKCRISTCYPHRSDRKLLRYPQIYPQEVSYE